MVTIYVGPKQKEFYVHKALLCKSADFFKGAFRPEFKEGQEGVMYMPDDEPQAFTLFVDYIYRSKIAIGNTENHLNNLYDFYYFADKLCLTELKDKIMDAIQDMTLKYDLKDQLVTPKLIKKAMQQVSPVNEGLKNFCIFSMVFVLISKWHQDPNFTDENRNPMANSEREDEDEDPPKVWIKKDEMKEIWNLCKDDFNFFFGFQTQLTSELQDRRAEPSDPRERIEDDNFDRCYFHCHKRGFDCRASEAKEEELNFIPNSTGEN
jgi:BTB/POZ domain